MKDHHRMRAWDESRMDYVSGPNWVEWSVNKDGFITASNYNHSGNTQHLVVELFSGVQDQYGVPIFSGDIVDSDNGRYKVEFKIGAFWCGGELLVGLKHKEIVGNIHQNPELLS